MIGASTDTLAHAQDVMNTIVLAALEITRLWLRKDVNSKMLRSVVFVSSIASRFGARDFATYCASKAALEA